MEIPHIKRESNTQNTKKVENPHFDPPARGFFFLKEAHPPGTASGKRSIFMDIDLDLKIMTPYIGVVLIILSSFEER